jgi:uridine phosphorylase
MPMNNDRENVHRYFGGQAKPGDVAPYVLVPGSKSRVEMIASRWEKAWKVADHYEFLLYTGEYAGFPISACSTGIGGTSVSIAVEELALLGAKTYLRVGVTSPLKDELEPGQAVIARGAVRWDGASLDYVRPEYPALAHFEVIMAAISAVEHLSIPYKVGVIGDMASLGPNQRDNYRHFLFDRTEPMRQALYEAGVIDGTGESASLFVQCSIYGFRAGAINLNGEDKAAGRWDPSCEEKAVQVGLETMRILAAWDQIKIKKGLPYITPDNPKK